MGYSVAVSLATTIILSHDEGWNSEEYTQAAINATAQVAAQYAVSSYFAAGSAGAAGVGAGVAHLISAGVNDLFADDHMNSHQWQSTVNTAGVMMAAAYAGSALGSAIAAGSLLGPIGAIVAVIVTQFLGGKEYKEGEYPSPYEFLSITAKEDGSGNIIYGLEKEG